MKIPTIKALAKLSIGVFCIGTALADTDQCITIPENEVVSLFEADNGSYQLSSFDSLEIEVGAGSNDENLFFTPNSDQDRSLNVVTPGGFAYQVMAGQMLKVKDDGIGENAVLIDAEGGCEAIAALLGDDSGFPVIAAVIGGGALAYAISKDDDDDTVDVVVPEEEVETPTPVVTTGGGNTRTQPYFCGITGCSSRESFLRGRCHIKPFEPNNCGVNTSPSS